MVKAYIQKSLKDLDKAKSNFDKIKVLMNKMKKDLSLLSDYKKIKKNIYNLENEINDLNKNYFNIKRC